jgi:sirohydrochlorin cobaltochelatase
MNAFRSLLRVTVLAGTALLLAPPVAGAQKVGTIVIAHGGDSIWNAHVREVAQQVKTGGPVEVSFLMGAGAKTARFQDAVARLEQQGVSQIVVVPMLVSSHSGHYDQVRWLGGEEVQLTETMHHHLHMAGIDRAVTKTPIRVTKAMDASAEVAQVLADRALALTKSPKEQALLIVGHGPNSAEDYAAWMENLRPVADSVKKITGFRDVRVDLVRDDAPAPVRAEAVRRVRELIELQHLVTGKEVIVVPVLVSKGSVSRSKVPNDIKGTPSLYAGEPLLPHPAMARWIESRVREAAGVASR